MTYAEIAKEARADLPLIFGYYKHQRKLIERVARSATRFPCAHFIDYTTPTRNRYLLVTHIFRRFVHRGGAGFYPILIQKKERGYAAHHLLLDKHKTEYMMTLLPHVYDQYAARKNINKTGIELVKHFAAHNMTSENDYTKDLSSREAKKRDTDSAHICMDEGVLMGELVSEDHIVIHTFITYDMTSGHQEEVFTQKKNSLKDPFENHKKTWYQK